MFAPLEVVSGLEIPSFVMLDIRPPPFVVCWIIRLRPPCFCCPFASDKTSGGWLSYMVAGTGVSDKSGCRDIW